MSHLVLTAVYGTPNRFHSGPRSARVFAQVLQGGSRLYLFHLLHDGSGPTTVRVRADDLSTADALRAGFAIAETDLPLVGSAAELAERLRVTPPEEDLELPRRDGLEMAAAAAKFPVSLLITLNEHGNDPTLEEFPGWSVRTARAAQSRIGARS